MPCRPPGSSAAPVVGECNHAVLAPPTIAAELVAYNTYSVVYKGINILSLDLK